MLSETLKSLRAQNGYTQQNIADFLGIERSTYSYYETGKTQPSTAILARLSCLFHVGLEDIIPSSYKSAPILDLECSSPESDLFRENFEHFSSLSFEEQQLVMNFRACADKRRFLDAVKGVVVDGEPGQPEI